MKNWFINFAALIRLTGKRLARIKMLYITQWTMNTVGKNIGENHIAIRRQEIVIIWTDWPINLMYCTGGKFVAYCCHCFLTVTSYLCNCLIPCLCCYVRIYRLGDMWIILPYAVVVRILYNFVESMLYSFV